MQRILSGRGHGIRFRTVPNKASESDGKQRLITLVYLHKGQPKLPQRRCCFYSWPPAMLHGCCNLSSSCPVCLPLHLFVLSQSVCVCVCVCVCLCARVCICGIPEMLRALRHACLCCSLNCSLDGQIFSLLVRVLPVNGCCEAPKANAAAVSQAKMHRCS